MTNSEVTMDLSDEDLRQVSGGSGHEQRWMPETSIDLTSGGAMSNGGGGHCALPVPEDAARTFEGLPHPDWVDAALSLDGMRLVVDLQGGASSGEHLEPSVSHCSMRGDEMPRDVADCWLPPGGSPHHGDPAPDAPATTLGPANGVQLPEESAARVEAQQASVASALALPELGG